MRRIEVHDAARAVGMFGDLARAAGNLPALAEHLGAIGIGVFDRMVVEDVAVFLAGANLAAAHALGFDGVAVLDPIANVEVVDVLLADVVAAEPGEEIPIADLVFQLGKICRERKAAWPGCRRSNSSEARRGRRSRHRECFESLPDTTADGGAAGRRQL